MSSAPYFPIIPGRPWAIDTYCCEGAASRGLYAAGYNVVGVDLFKHTNAKGQRVGYSRSRYPFPSWQGDAIHALDWLVRGTGLVFGLGTWRLTLNLHDFALWWASPPCQHASAGTRALRAHGKSEHPAFIEPTRERVEAIVRDTGANWVIENVSGAALIDPVLLCGSMFDLRAEDADGVMLRLERHRLFESSFPIVAPKACNDDDQEGWAAGVYGGSRRASRLPGESLAHVANRDRLAARFERHGGYVPRDPDVQRRLLGLPADHGMTQGGMKECVPPAYAAHIGRQALAATRAAA